PTLRCLSRFAQVAARARRRRRISTMGRSSGSSRWLSGRGRWQRRMPQEAAGLDAEFESLDADLLAVLEELRTLASGLHPAALSRRGLGPALTTLARRSRVPWVLDVRLLGGVAEPVEVAAYYVVAEALTNATKHAKASRVDVTVELRDGRLWVCVRDDGVGGADPAGGSGLVGLKDRIEA